MTTTNTRALNGAPIAFSGFAAESLHLAVQAARQVIRRHRTRRALNQLSDRSLKDIGLHRSEIDSIAQALAAGRGDGSRTVPHQFDLLR